MDPKLSQSFIPKKTFDAPQRKPVQRIGVIFLISFVLFLASIAASVGLFAWQMILKSSINEKNQTLESARASFDTGVISDLRRTSDRIAAIEGLLDRHASLSRLFQFLEENTVIEVGFTEFAYNRGPDGSILAELSGEAEDFNALAAQSKVLAENEAVLNPVFSAMNLNEAGAVTFTLKFGVSPSLVAYDPQPSIAPAGQSVQATSTPANLATSSMPVPGGTVFPARTTPANPGQATTSPAQRPAP